MTVKYVEFGIIPNATPDWGTNGFTVFQMQYPLPPGLVVESLGFYHSTSVSTYLKIGKYLSVGPSFSMEVDVQCVHPGGGWFDVPLPQPLLILPQANAMTCMGCWMHGLMGSFNNLLRGYMANNQTSFQSGYATDTGSVPVMRWRGTDTFYRGQEDMGGGM